MNLINQLISNYLNNQIITSQVVVNWLLNNQNNSNSIFLLGYLSLYGIKMNENKEKAFKLFINASKQDHILAQYYIGFCYKHGHGVKKDEKLAFEYYKKVVDKDLNIQVKK